MYVGFPVDTYCHFPVTFCYVGLFRRRGLSVNLAVFRCPNSIGWDLTKGPPECRIKKDRF